MVHSERGMLGRAGGRKLIEHKHSPKYMYAWLLQEVCTCTMYIANPGTCAAAQQAPVYVCAHGTNNVFTILALCLCS